MRKLRIGVLDLVTKSPNPSLYGRVMNANLASIMPQIIGVWCSQMGHEVSFCVYTGLEDLMVELPKDLDLIFIGTFTQSAQLSYALSNMFRQRGAVTVMRAAIRKTRPSISTTCSASPIRKWCSRY